MYIRQVVLFLSWIAPPGIEAGQSGSLEAGEA